MSEIRIGISGWTYAPWRGDFYPSDLTQKRELEYASRQVNSIEVNGTFYSLQKPQTFLHWYDQTPENFIFAIKAPRFITHVRRLKDCQEPLCTFLASGLLCLKDKLGPILWQFPPNVTLKDDRFEKFIQLLPHDSNHAAELSKKHSPKIRDRCHTETSGNYPVRHAFEFRHPSFQNPNFIEILRANKIAVVVANSGKKSPLFEDLTSDFVYIRMHGENPAFKKGYTESELNRMADKIKKWSNGSQAGPMPGKKDIFAYFDNEVKENAPHDAIRLLKKLKIQLHSDPGLGS